MAPAPDPVRDVIEQAATHRDRDWAGANSMHVVRQLIEASGARRVLEIGGGRAPALKQATVAALDLDYVSSDIDVNELDRAPDWVRVVALDIQTQQPAAIGAHGTFDLAFSKWVMEHVADYRLAYRNIRRLLRDGGVHFAFHPVLFAAPFVANRLLPDAVTGPLVRGLLDNRGEDGRPKFPAFYSGCRVSAGVRDAIRAEGFRDVWQLPFYGHNYYKGIPVLRQLHATATAALARANATPFAAFAFTIVRR